MTQQIETLTVDGTITLAGDARVTVYGGYIGSTVSLSVAVGLGDGSAAIAALVRSAVALSAAVSAQYATGGSGADVVLTDHQSRANDDALEMTVADDTCVGINAGSSSQTQAGSGLTNAYCTLADYKSYQRITTTDATDDYFIELAINSASRWIDKESQTNFYPLGVTRHFDTPVYPDRLLLFPAYCQNVTDVQNGDGSIITSAQYALYPPDDLPKYGISLRPTSGITWQATAGDPIQAIVITANWGYSATAPDDIKLACMEISKSLYSRRFGENMNMRTVITAGGVVQIPEGVPDWAATAISHYRRLGFG